jgi:hypothetical protein
MEEYEGEDLDMPFIPIRSTFGRFSHHGKFSLVSGTAPEEPVVSKYGHAYERRLIEKYLDTNGNKCPVTNEPLTKDDLIVVKGNFFSERFGFYDHFRKKREQFPPTFPIIPSIFFCLLFIFLA